VLEVEHLGGALEVRVVVHERETVLAGQHGGEQVCDADCTMPPGASKVVIGR
jgi:hypothetical protein